MTMRPTLVFLHTAAVHVPTFSALVAELAPGIPIHHIVAEDLLAEARANGLTPALAKRVAAQIAAAGAVGAVLCTCSTIGGLAEAAATPEGPPVLRVDRAMAEAAVAAGPRIALVAALASTLAPTRALIEEVAAQVRPTVTINEILCEEAWPLFEIGDSTGYLAAIEICIRAVAPTVDVIVLAQASMAGAALRCADLAVPVLSSPRLGVEAALKLLNS